MNKYPNSGIISDAKTRIHPNSPDMNGDITPMAASLPWWMETLCTLWG